MKLILLIALLLLPGAFALQLGNNAQVVLGSDDAQLRQSLQNGLGLSQSQFVDATDADPGKDLLVIGGPCGNPLWERYSAMTCESWPYKDGEGIVLSVRNGSVILLAGTQAEDTKFIVDQFIVSTRTARAAAGDEEDDTAADIGEGDEFTISPGGSKTVTIGGEDYVINGVKLNGTMVREITVGGQRFSNLAEGRTFTTSDDLLVKIVDVTATGVKLSVTSFDEEDASDDTSSGRITIGVGEEDSIRISGEEITVSGLEIDGNEITEVTIDGTRYTGLTDGSVKTTGDLRIEVTDVSDDEATFSIEETDSESLEKGDDFTVGVGDSKTVQLDGDDVEFKDVTVNDNEVTLTADGSVHTDLQEDDTFKVNGVTLRVDDIGNDDVTLVVDST